ncbi:hypothetical protein MKX01_000726 [Papaver californicum]|nr:hypothetical protein MKX01_000726 [Papaver californicum]
MDGSHGTEGGCICLDENATEITNQEPGVDEPIEFSSILTNEAIDLCPKPKPASKDQLMTLLDLRNVREEVLRGMEHEKRWVDHLDQALVKLHKDIYARPEKGIGLCSSEEELNNLLALSDATWEKDIG